MTTTTDLARAHEMWFSVSALELAGKYRTRVEDPTGEGRYAGQRIPDWEAVGYAVRRLFCLDEPEVEGAHPQGEVTHEAVETVTRELGDTERGIVESWVRYGPIGDVDFASNPWPLVNGRHRLTGVWSVRPEWQLPVTWSSPDPDHEPVAVANMILDDAVAVQRALEAGTIDLTHTRVNSEFVAGIRELAQRPRYTVQTRDPKHFAFDGPLPGSEPAVFSDGDGYMQVWSWCNEADLLLVIEADGDLSRGPVYRKLASIVHRGGNESLARLVEDSDQIQVLAAVATSAGPYWQHETITPDELTVTRELRRSKEPQHFRFGELTWSSTIVRESQGSEK